MKEDYKNFYQKDSERIQNTEISDERDKVGSLLLNSDKKVLIMGIILLMRCESKVLKISYKLEQLIKGTSLYNVFCYVKNNAENNTITVPSKLIDKFSNSGEDLKIVEYIVKCYDEKVELSILDYIKLLDITVLNFEIRKTTKNIETLRNMDRNNEDVISNLNFNVKKLMELNKKLKNIEKGVHHE